MCLEVDHFEVLKPACARLAWQLLDTEDCDPREAVAVVEEGEEAGVGLPLVAPQRRKSRPTCSS